MTAAVVRRTLALLFLLLLTAWTPGPAQASPSIATLGAHASGLDPAPLLETRFADPREDLNTQLAAGDWRGNPKGLSNFGSSSQALWLRFRVQEIGRASCRERVS
jgi:hypothetical protein